MENEIERLQTACSEAYQMIAALAGELGVFGSEEVQRVLDNLDAASSGAPAPHRSPLPFHVPDKTTMRRRDGCREEVLTAARRLQAAGHQDFTPMEIIEQMQRNGTVYPERTIRTHVISRMCANAPDNHTPKYDDLVRVGRGRYRLRNA